MTLRRYENEKGFTLIELMIVVAIIGILAALSMAAYRSHQCKVKQSEAKSLLGMIRIGEEAYYAEYDTFSSDPLAIGSFSPKGETRYDYSIATASGGYTATAAGKADKGVDGDVWTMNQEGQLVNLTSACS